MDVYLEYFTRSSLGGIMELARKGLECAKPEILRRMNVTEYLICRKRSAGTGSLRWQATALPLPMTGWKRRPHALRPAADESV